ncbi:spore coat U domain-containing protein [Paraburkholderia acidicola]|uniref:Spore coat U domain-containing protein n=1 Tax=Paraburkholderia acidicola TaxID=1912599 RepID=A0ABV1LU54_9BURK
MRKQFMQMIGGVAIAWPFTAMPSGQVTGAMQVSLQVNRGCAIAGLVGSANVGQLDFGAQGPLWSDYLTADSRATSNGAVHIICSPEISGFRVSVDSGRNGNQSTRYLIKRDKLGHVVGQIPYNVYRDAARSEPYVPLLPQAFVIDGRGRGVTLPLYGVVNSRNEAIPAGDYQDLLGITLDW